MAETSACIENTECMNELGAFDEESTRFSDIKNGLLRNLINCNCQYYRQENLGPLPNVCLSNDGSDSSSPSKPNLKSCVDIASNPSCGDYNSGFECLAGDDTETYFPSQNPKHTEQAFFYYGVPVIDSIVSIFMLMLIGVRTATIGTELTLLRALMCFVSIVMFLIGKSVVFSIAQEYGVVLEYIPLIGIMAFATRPSALVLSIYCLLLVYMLTPGIGVVPAALNVLTSNNAFVARQSFDDPEPLSSCPFNGDTSRFGCFCKETDSNTGTNLEFTPRWAYQGQAWVQLLVVLVVGYGFAAVAQITHGLLSLTELMSSRAQPQRDSSGVALSGYAKNVPYASPHNGAGAGV